MIKAIKIHKKKRKINIATEEIKWTVLLPAWKKDNNNNKKVVMKFCQDDVTLLSHESL